MNNTDNFKNFWWFLIVVVVGIYLYSRLDQLTAGNPNNFDIVVFVIWIGVCLAPIFKDINIFGIKLKQEIDELKKDVSHQLQILKTEIKSSIEVSSSNNNHIYVSTPEPPKDSEIPDLAKQVQDALKKMGISGAEPQMNFSTSVDTVHVELFKIRLSFENLIRRYTRKNGGVGRRYSLAKLLRDLRDTNSISHEIYSGVSEVISICNYAAHGEDITETQANFVKESAPGLLKALERELSNGV